MVDLLMNRESIAPGPQSGRIYRRILLVLLLLAVPVLSTAAKHDWYMPRVNAAHHLTAAVKMKVKAFQPVPAQSQAAQPVPRVVLPVPRISQLLETSVQAPVSRIESVVVPPLRAPPVSLFV